MSARACLLALVLGGCMVGPDYRRPAVPTTATFRGQDRAQAGSFADLPWWQIFRDPALAALIRDALDHSYDLADAVARVEVARENAAAAAAAIWPSLRASAGPSYQQVFNPLTIPGRPIGNYRYQAFAVQGSVSWELDLWGRLRRTSEAARAQLLASDENRRAVIVSLVGDVAEAYFNLLTLDRQLEISHATVAARKETLHLFAEQEAGGVGDHLTTATEEANLASAGAVIPDLERRIAQAENQLSVLLGRPPGPIRRTAAALSAAAPTLPPAGLPTRLLERRPDVRAVEAQVMAANAQVGAALAAIFPTLGLDASGGLQSTALSTLFTSNALMFAIAPVVGWLLPVLNGTQTLHQYRAQQAALVVAIADYRRVVLQALAEVATAQTDIVKLAEARTLQEHEVQARTETVRLSKLRFTVGAASYLDVVAAEQNLFPAELSLARTMGAQFIAYTQLYRALGGGWSDTGE